MKSPSSSSGITKAWIEFMLTDYESRKTPQSTVTVKSFAVKNATKPGESFNAELILLDVEASLSNGGQPENGSEEKEYHLVVKFLTKDPLSREVIKRCGYHIKELKMYSEVVKELNDFQAAHADDEYRIFLPEFIYGKCTEKEYVLVMENIKVLGYETNPKKEGLNFEHTMVAVNHVARLHAVSYAYDKMYNFQEKFPCFQFSSAISTFFKPVVWASLNNVITFLKSQETYEDMVKKLERGRTTLPVKFAALWDDQTRHKFLTLTHGDFWNSNLMYRHTVGDQGEITEEDGDHIESLKLIDWQISQWNNPVFDLHYLLNTSTSFAMRRKHVEEILRHYHATFTKATTRMGTPVPNWNYEQFKAEFERTSLVGFLMGMCLIQGTLSKAGENINRGGSTCCPASCWLVHKVKTGFAKIIVSLAFKPSSSYILQASVKRVLHPIGLELVEGSNEVLNTRLLDLLMEADEKGVLDVLSL